MNKTRYSVVVGLIAVAHYAVSPCIPGHGDGAPDAPPLASIVAVSTTGSVAFDRVNLSINTIIDTEYAVPAIERRPAMVVPALPPTVVASSVGAICPGIVTFKSTA
jgi:hypothetical protein